MSQRRRVVDAHGKGGLVELGITAFLTDQGIAPAELAREVETRGFSSMWLPQHTHMPIRGGQPPALVDGVTFEDYKRGLDPLVSLATAAAVTERIRLCTGILLAAQLGPINMSKQIATLDHLAGGRVIVGVGSGWNEAEAEDHGLDFSKRRQVLREHVLCMQAVWRDEIVEFHGESMNLEPCWSWPKPVKGKVPVVIGGAALDSVFEAICDYGDGWLPIGGAGVQAGMARLRQQAEAVGRDPEQLMVIPFGTLPTVGKLGHYEEIGVTEVVLRIRNGSRDEVLHQLDAYEEFL
jgi:probable F420-dependent oxidoreductase